MRILTLLVWAFLSAVVLGNMFLGNAPATYSDKDRSLLNQLIREHASCTDVVCTIWRKRDQ